MSKILIESIGSSSDPIYSHLQPLIDFLLKNGNNLSHNFVWGSNREGYYCHLAKPIDFNLLERVFEIPNSIHFIAARNTIYCERTGSIIQTYKN